MSASHLIIDTNLLVLLSVGSASPAFIAAHKRTRAYTADDFKLLTMLLAEAGAVVITPNILTETSNLIRQFAMPGRAAVLDAFRDIVAMAQECYVASTDAVARPEFVRLGLTDCAVIAAQSPDTTLLTDDLGLYLASIAAGRRAVSFRHERQRRIV